MKRTHETICLSVAVILVVYNVANAQRQDTAFVFTGQLDAQITQASQTCEFEFTLWDEMEGGQRTGRTLAFDGWESNRPRVPIKNNQYEVMLDFGLSIEDSESLWVEARYSCGRAAPWYVLENRIAIDEEMYFALDDKIKPTRINNNRPIQNIDPIIIEEAGLGTPDGHSLDAADGDPIDVVFVDNDGNVGVGITTPTDKLHVVGNATIDGDLTINSKIQVNGDNNPLEIHVNGTRALRFEYADAFSEAPNFIAGHPENTVVPGKAGATIGGGGGTGLNKNQVSEDWGTVSGGKGNHAFGMLGTVGGGADNTATGEGSTIAGGQAGDATGIFSTISGGLSNTALGDNSAIGGGTTNSAEGLGSTIAGGDGNTTVGDYSTVPGGFNNEAVGAFSFAAGRRAKANHNGSFVWGDSTAADFASSGPNQFIIRASGGVGIGTSFPSADLHIRRPDDDTAQLYLTGINQGAGMVYVGSNTGFGGGMSYSGDDIPDIVGTGGRITHFRRDNSVDTEVFSYAWNNNNVVFRGNVTIDGDLQVTGNTTNFVHRGPWTATRDNLVGTTDVIMISSSTAFCSLSFYSVTDVDTFAEVAVCNVYISGGFWHVAAFLGTSSDADVACQARCLQWD